MAINDINIMEIIQQYAVIPVAVVCLLIGAFLKASLPEFPNKFIPLALTAVALVGVLWMNGWAFTPQNILAGICSAALAVYIHQNGKHLLTSHGSSEDVMKPPNTEGTDAE